MHFQANENHRGFLGTGHIDWPPICRALSEIGYAGADHARAVPPRRTTASRVPLAQWQPPAYDEDEDLAPQRLRFSRAALHAASPLVIRIGWIGCGTHAAEMLLPQLSRLPVTIAALADTERRATGPGRRPLRGRQARYADAEALLAHAGLDAVGMAVGPAVHARIGAAALGAGCRSSWRSRPPRPRARRRRWPTPPRAPGGPAWSAS